LSIASIFVSLLQFVPDPRNVPIKILQVVNVYSCQNTIPQA